MSGLSSYWPWIIAGAILVAASFVLYRIRDSRGIDGGEVPDDRTRTYRERISTLLGQWRDQWRDHFRYSVIPPLLSRTDLFERREVTVKTISNEYELAERVQDRPFVRMAVASIFQELTGATCKTDKAGAVLMALQDLYKVQAEGEAIDVMRAQIGEHSKLTQMQVEASEREAQAMEALKNMAL